MNRLKILILMMVSVLTTPAGAEISDRHGVPAASLSENILIVLHPAQKTTLSTEVFSTIQKINVDMGEAFQKGDILIELDAGIYQAERRKAEAELALATTVYETSRQLYHQQSISDAEMARARAEQEMARAGLAIAQKRHNACYLRAPYDGRVVRRLAQEGEFVQQGQQLIEILDPGVMRAEFLAPAPYWRRLSVGQVFPARVKGFDRAFDCRISHVSPILESNTATFQVYGEIDNAANRLCGGMTGEILLSFPDED